MEILLTNDDGVESRALQPFARALGTLGEVKVVVPAKERSWVGKAISRFEDLEVTRHSHDGVTVHAVSGYPADCVQLGVFNLFERPPDVVVSGINIGANHGEAFVMCSGTVGAAIEAAIVGIPALAFSAVPGAGWATWSPWARSPDADGMWERLAALATEIASDSLSGGFPDDVDVVKVELPAEATGTSPRRVVPIAPIRYGRLFQPAPGGGYHHRFPGGALPVGPVEDTDWTLVDHGAVAITPLRMNMSAPADEAFRSRLERF